MGLETGEFIADLVQTNPVTATDPVTEGSHHLRLLKKVIQQSLGNMPGLLQFPTNDTWFQQSNFAADGMINMIKVNASDKVEIGAALMVVGQLVGSGDIAESMYITGGDDFSTSANIILYGGNHPTAPGNIIFRDSASVLLKYDQTLGNWASSIPFSVEGTLTVTGKIASAITALNPYAPDAAESMGLSTLGPFGGGLGFRDSGGGGDSGIWLQGGGATVDMYFGVGAAGGALTANFIIKDTGEISVPNGPLIISGGAGVFTIKGTQPSITLTENDAIADSGRWDMISLDSQLNFRVVADNGSTADVWMLVQRTAAVTTNVIITPTLTLSDDVSFTKAAIHAGDIRMPDDTSITGLIELGTFGNSIGRFAGTGALTITGAQGNINITGVPVDITGGALAVTAGAITASGDITAFA